MLYGFLKHFAERLSITGVDTKADHEIKVKSLCRRDPVDAFSDLSHFFIPLLKLSGVAVERFQYAPSFRRSQQLAYFRFCIVLLECIGLDGAIKLVLTEHASIVAQFGDLRNRISVV